MPRSQAICLLARPAISPSSTSRSRFERLASRPSISACSAWRLYGLDRVASEPSAPRRAVLRRRTASRKSPPRRFSSPRPQAEHRLRCDAWMSHHASMSSSVRTRSAAPSMSSYWRLRIDQKKAISAVRPSATPLARDKRAHSCRSHLAPPPCPHAAKARFRRLADAKKPDRTEPIRLPMNRGRQRRRRWRRPPDLRRQCRRRQTPRPRPLWRRTAATTHNNSGGYQNGPRLSRRGSFYAPSRPCRELGHCSSG